MTELCSPDPLIDGYSDIALAPLRDIYANAYKNGDSEEMTFFKLSTVCACGLTCACEYVCVLQCSSLCSSMYQCVC